MPRYTGKLYEDLMQLARILGALSPTQWMKFIDHPINCCRQNTKPVMIAVLLIPAAYLPNGYYQNSNVV